jgi:hypothetical protein
MRTAVYISYITFAINQLAMLISYIKQYGESVFITTLL